MSFKSNAGRMWLVKGYTFDEFNIISVVKRNDSSYVIDDKYLELYFGSYKIKDDKILIKWDGQESEATYSKISFDEWIEVYDKSNIRIK